MVEGSRSGVEEMIEGVERPRYKLLTVSNRGPAEHRWSDEGGIETVPGQGGLATALRVAATLHPTIWLSSPLTDVDRLIAEGNANLQIKDGASHFVITDPGEYDLFYGRFSNEVLWFLQHALAWPDDLDRAEREHAWRDGYQKVNAAFAEKVIDEIDDGCVRAVMFHDYHFYTAPAIVRAARPRAFLQHFIHIPWPAASEWKRLEAPIVREICRGLLGNDSVVFQTRECATNFLDTCAYFLPECAIDVAA